MVQKSGQPVEVGSLSHYLYETLSLTGFHTCQAVVGDFFHQQYSTISTLPVFPPKKGD